MSGTTLALASLAALGVAAVVTTPVWLWHRRKRKRADALLRQAAVTGEANEPRESIDPSEGKAGE